MSNDKPDSAAWSGEAHGLTARLKLARLIEQHEVGVELPGATSWLTPEEKRVVIDALRSAPSTPSTAELSIKPVAWMVEGKNMNGHDQLWFYTKPEWPDSHREHGHKVTPLFAAIQSAAAEREPTFIPFDCHYDGNIDRCDKDCKQLGECKRRTTGVRPTATPNKKDPE